MKHPNSYKDATVPASSAVAEVSLKSAYDGSEYADMERSLLRLPGVAHSLTLTLPPLAVLVLKPS
jgi:hypothetical protein